MIELRPGHSPPHVTMAAFTALGSHQMSSVALARTQPSASALLRVAACAYVCLGAVQMPCRCRTCNMHARAAVHGSLHGRLGVVAKDGSLDNLVRVEEVHAGKHLRHRILHSLLRATRPGRPHQVRVGVGLPPGGLEWEVDILRALFEAGGTVPPEALGRAYPVLRYGWARHGSPGKSPAVVTATDGSNALMKPAVLRRERVARQVARALRGLLEEAHTLGAGDLVRRDRAPEWEGGRASGALVN